MSSTINSSTFIFGSNGLNDSSQRVYIDGIRQTQVPAAIWLFAICICGILGNLLVLHVFRTKFRLSNYKVFIITVALIDLFACSVAIPLELVLMFTGYTIDDSNGRMCKYSRFFDVLLTVSAAFVLLAISIDRFRKVCRPFGIQISTTSAKVICVLSLVIGLFVSWPTMFVFGKKSSTKVVDDQVTVIIDCTLLDEATISKTAFIFIAFLMILSTLGLASVIILYCRVNSKLKKRSMRRSRTNHFRPEINERTTEDFELESVSNENVLNKDHTKENNPYDKTHTDLNSEKAAAEHAINKNHCFKGNCQKEISVGPMKRAKDSCVGNLEEKSMSYKTNRQVGKVSVHNVSADKIASEFCSNTSDEDCGHMCSSSSSHILAVSHIHR